MKPKHIALIFAGGTGQRMNSKSTPKQFLEVHGKPIIIYTLEQFELNPDIDAIIIASLPEKIEYLETLIKKYDVTKVASVIPGGDTGQLSIYNTLVEAAKLFSEDSIVLIHDGVRPLINQETISSCIEMVSKHGNAVTTAPAVETVFISNPEGTGIESIIQRSRCNLARAPQGFKLGDILSVHNRALSEGVFNSIDSASLMDSYGVKLHMVEGPIENIKITTPLDFYTFRGILDAQENLQILG